MKNRILQKLPSQLKTNKYIDKKNKFKKKMKQNSTKKTVKYTNGYEIKASENIFNVSKR